MKLNVHDYFLNKTVNTDMFLNHINYDEFINMSLKTDSFSYIFDKYIESTNNQELIKKKQFFYGFHRFINDPYILLFIFWNIKFQKTKKAINGSINQNKKGTIANFVQMNKDVGYSVAKFQKNLKYLYIIWKNKKLSKILKNHYFSMSEISEQTIQDIIDNSNMDIEFVNKIINLTK